MSAPTSPSASSFGARRPSNKLSLDLSSIQPLWQPSPPSNTLLVTELNDLKLFQPSSLDSIKSRITEVAPLNSFSPLPSLRRIVCSFLTIDAAIQVRQLLDGDAILGSNVRARVYFGEHTPVEDAEEVRKRKLLEAPHPGKLFFISPPPSPPHGWQLRNEDPPNKEVHASDLADALGKLGRINTDHNSYENGGRPDTPASVTDVPMLDAGSQDASRTTTWPDSAISQRSRSSTLIYHPENHGGSPGLPAVMVEDTTINPSASDSEMEISPIEFEESPKRILSHTARPPVELMR